MGIAAYNRGSKLTRTNISEVIHGSQARADIRARLWADALELGAILSFNGAGGAVIVAGPDIRAVPSQGGIARIQGFAMHRYGGDAIWRGSWESRSAWETALRVVEHVGRVRPFRIVMSDR